MGETEFYKKFPDAEAELDTLVEESHHSAHLDEGDRRCDEYRDRMMGD